MTESKGEEILMDIVSEQVREIAQYRCQLSIARAALEAWRKWSLVVESAVRHDAPRDHAAILAVINQNKDALKITDPSNGDSGEG